MVTESTATRTIVIIEDDALLCSALDDALSDDHTRVVHAQTGAEGLALCKRMSVDVVLLDQQLPDGAGAALCPSILDASDQTKIVFMTAYPSFENAVAALKAGATDYLTKPFELEELKLAVANALRMAELERIEQLHTRTLEWEHRSTVFLGMSRAMRDTLQLAKVAVSSEAPVLITGETGTGKTLLARYIHSQGPRRALPFVSLNCAALPESLAESELFGHERGAFTGAEAARRGVFEMAESGSVFLDEVGAMAPHLQAKLLGVLEDRVLRRLGGETTRRVKARLLAATNLDVESAVAAGAFRSDLFYRLNVVRIDIPPLRQRVDDLGPLCRHLVHSIANLELELPPAELDRLAAYDWPGNVRELRNVLERSLLIHSPDRLRPSSLIRETSGPRPAAPAATEAPTHLTLEEVERRTIAETLGRHRGNLTRTAEALGIALSTLKRKVKAHGLRPSSLGGAS